MSSWLTYVMIYNDTVLFHIQPKLSMSHKISVQLKRNQTTDRKLNVLLKTIQTLIQAQRTLYLKLTI